MHHTIPHTIKLQDGTLCNLNKRLAKHQSSLVALLQQTVTDPRAGPGVRHPLVLILMIVFIGLLAGCRDLQDACLFAQINKEQFRQWCTLPLTHGIPHPTTVSRVFQQLNPDELVVTWVQFLGTMGIPLGTVYSFDGKTMRAVTGETTIRHILSLFSHDQHLAIGQVGVSAKENEIPALDRLLKQGQTLDTITGKLFIGDALHTQKTTCKAILKAGADYLFSVKNNQRKLKQAIEAELDRRHVRAPGSLGVYTDVDLTRGRHITTTVTVVTAKDEGEELLPTLRGSNHWEGVQTMGILHRTGTRTSKDGTLHQVNETIGCITSRPLTAEAVTTHLHNHWCIENNLHWVKDEVFGEDKHTLRKGKAPQIMSWLRSMVISLCNGLRLKSITGTIRNLEKSSELLAQFLSMAAVV
jgi:predicted transposase YbfD/YdcC